jgi:phosphohistidine phosphatase
MRHAKSSWEHSSLKDFDRPLAERGLSDAPLMGRFVNKTGYKPGFVISSPAQRAKETTQLFAEAAIIDEQQITWNEDLYFGSVGDYISAIKQVDDKIERLLLVGHNPLMEQAAGILAGSEHRTAIRMPTAALVCLESFTESWQYIAPGTCQLKWMMIPKVLKTVSNNQS